MSETVVRSDLANFLDGKVVCPRQNQEGKTDTELEAAAVSEFRSFITKRYSHYAKYITYEEMCHLWDCENESYLRTLPTRDRIIMVEVEGEILAKIDHEEVRNTLETRLITIKASKHKKKHAHHELGAREFTFTYSPKWFSDPEARSIMEQAINKLMRYYKNDIVVFRAVGEVGGNGLSHVHCFYKLRNGRKITDKNFQRAYPPWDTSVRQGFTGHKGGHHANVRNESDFQGYIEKEIENAWLDIKFNLEEDT